MASQEKGQAETRTNIVRAGLGNVEAHLRVGLGLSARFHLTRGLGGGIIMAYE